MTQEITLKIRMSSGCSEAALFDHLTAFVEHVEQYATESYVKKVRTSWDESHSVTVTITKSEIES